MSRFPSFSSWLKHYNSIRVAAACIPDQSTEILHSRNPSRRMGQGSNQPLTEITARNLPEGIGRPERKADNFISNCEPTV
jgi:hypothetical protein